METSLEVKLDYLPRLPQNPDVGIGCIGSGFIMADCHLVAYRQAGFNPVAIAARTQTNSRAVAERHGIPKVYRTYQELLQDPAVAIVDIAVPPDKQIEIVREAVKHGDHIKGILVQKPMAVSYAEAKELVQLCGEAGIKLG